MQFIAICPPLVKGNVGSSDESKCVVVDLPIQRCESFVYLSYVMMSHRVMKPEKWNRLF